MFTNRIKYQDPPVLSIQSKTVIFLAPYPKIEIELLINLIKGGSPYTQLPRINVYFIMYGQ